MAGTDALKYARNSWLYDPFDVVGGNLQMEEGFTTPLTDDGAGSITIDPFHSKEMALSRRVGRGMARGCGGAVASRKQSRSDLLSGGWDDFLAPGVVP
jgi:hypothetical protein